MFVATAAKAEDLKSVVRAKMTETLGCSAAIKTCCLNGGLDPSQASYQGNGWVGTCEDIIDTFSLCTCPGAGGGLAASGTVSAAASSTASAATYTNPFQDCWTR